jgi:N-acetylmuramoyl-L-alanine amidase
MFKLYIDPGHGGNDPGATANGLQEKDLTLDIATRIRNILANEYDKVAVKMSRSNDTYLTLSQRTDEANAWNADYFLSVHVNAFNGSANGYEDYIYDELSNGSRTADIQKIMHDEVMKVNDLYDRGAKKANFHVLRESAMSSLLTENGFIDNDHDAAKLSDSNWRERVARGHVNGLARAFDLKHIAQAQSLEPSDNKEYRLITGTWTKASGIVNATKMLRDAGYGMLLYEVAEGNESYQIVDPDYRLMTGTYTGKNVAEAKAQELQEKFGWNIYVIDA